MVKVQGSLVSYKVLYKQQLLKWNLSCFENFHFLITDKDPK